MSKTPTTYAQALLIIAAVAAALRYLAGIDWPWALMVGAAVSVLIRTLMHPRSPRHEI